MEAPWTSTPQQILDYYAVDAKQGLSADQAAKHAEIYGRNGMSYQHDSNTFL